MPKEREREISTETSYINRGGKVYKRTITYTIVGNANWVEDDNDIRVQEAREVMGLNKDDKKNQDGYIVK